MMIADQIDNEKRPHLAPGRVGWERKSLYEKNWRALVDNKHLQSENREERWALGGDP